jgi:hypothetical protein
MTDLARRAVACKHWKWMPGMLYRQERYGLRPETATAPIIQGGGLPDFTDAATLGCLLALVRQAWDVNHIFTRYSEYVEGGEWDVPVRVQNKGYRTVVFFKGATEVEALVAALEAAE